ncbi:MAG: hypothetical protein ACLTX1_11745 [Hominenteromicrobium sp.]|uniref:hypothetical protein n=1 Tax=Hominenteromicrobium sp. TaxID=3073581 RepID=UPI00399210CD
MDKVKIKLNSSGIRQLLKSEEMGQMLKQQAEQVRARCGSGYSTDLYQASSRVIAGVFAETAEAAKQNSRENTLLKALGR